MTEKLANLSAFRASSPVSTFLKVFTAVFLLVVLVSVAITCILPESYASTARIMIEKDQAEAKSPDYDPYFIQTAFEIMQSSIVLNPVIDKLHLNEQWGKKYYAGQVLSSSQSLEILRQRLQLAPVRNTKLVSITVYSDDKVEAAQIANAITDSYQNYRAQNYQGPKSFTPPLLVQIVETAVPGRAPVRPNKPLNIFLGAVVGIFAASATGAIAAFVASLVRRRKQKLSATA